MKIILIGIQGAGKSTQGNMLRDKLNIPYLSSGHIFREMAKEKSPWGRYVKETVNSGALIPDDKTVQIVEEYLSKPEYSKGYILDGFPRTVPQAKAFSNGVDMVIYLDVSDKEALWRLSGRVDEGVREDNTLTAIRQRIELFHTHTKEVLGFYKRKGLLHSINGEQSILDIHREIMERIRMIEAAQRLAMANNHQA
jgi:adenylate kinase